MEEEPLLSASSFRYSPALERLLSSTMVVNPQERPYIANVIGQLEEIQPAPPGQDTTRI